MGPGRHVLAINFLIVFIPPAFSWSSTHNTRCSSPVSSPTDAICLSVMEMDMLMCIIYIIVLQLNESPGQCPVLEPLCSLCAVIKSLPVCWCVKSKHLAPRCYFDNEPVPVVDWHLQRNQQGILVDAIKRNHQTWHRGNLTSSPPTHCATLRCSLSCGLKSITNHVNKYRRPSILWFFTPKYKESCAFVVAAEIQDDLGGCQEHVKSICSHKERATGINGVACSGGHGKRVFDSVCVWVREHVWSGSVRHTCFPVGWIWWGPQGKEQTDSSESSSRGVRYPRVQRCSCQACSGSHDGLQVDRQAASQIQDLEFIKTLNDMILSTLQTQ